MTISSPSEYKFLLPIHYEIVDRTSVTETPHEVYELRRLTGLPELDAQRQQLLTQGGLTYKSFNQEEGVVHLQ